MRLFVLERILRCSSEAGDGQGSFDAGLKLIALDPDAWLGDLNHPVAMAAASRLPARSPDGRRQPGARPPRSQLELAHKRLDISLSGPQLAEAERRAAETALRDVSAELGDEAPDQLGEETGPGGGSRVESPSVLLERAQDKKFPARERAALAQAAAAALEAAGDRAAALAACRLALSLLKSVHPVYAGLTDGTLDTSRPRSLAPEPADSIRLRRLVRSIQRLDPASAEAPRGGLRLRITGLDLPPELALNLLVSLWDPAVEGTVGGPGAQAPLGQAPVQLDQAAWVGVADGRYRLQIKRGGSGTRFWRSLGGRANHFLGMLEIDFAALPEEVEVRGQAVELAIPGRLLEEVTLLEPTGGEVDLARDTFRWSGLPGAAYYEVELIGVEDLGGGTYYKPAQKFRAEGTSLRLADVSPLPAATLNVLTRGSTAAWVVRAHDARGRCIGRSSGPARTFAISGALEKP
ncbi:MAG: hypothetical protein HY721_27500 [Planctomycetes bacterium]|nr:hypothetical protein [Planctomycetota bacterium]